MLSFTSCCQGADQDCRYAEGDRHVLLLAAGPGPVVDLQVVSYGGNLRQRFRPVANDIDVLDRCSQSPVLNEKSASDIESEVPFAYPDRTDAMISSGAASPASIDVARIRGIGLNLNDSLRPFPVGETP